MLNERGAISKGMLVTTFVLLLILLGVGYFIYTSTIKPQTTYSAVYLKSGELYIGKLFHFPKMKLVDGYLLAAVRDERDPKKTLFRLNPLKDAMWAPEAVYLNPDQVLFTAPLRDDSKVAQALKNAQKKGLDAIEGENPLQPKNANPAAQEESDDTEKPKKK